MDSIYINQLAKLRLRFWYGIRFHEWPNKIGSIRFSHERKMINVPEAKLTN